MKRQKLMLRWLCLNKNTKYQLWTVQIWFHCWILCLQLPYRIYSSWAQLSGRISLLNPNKTSACRSQKIIAKEKKSATELINYRAMARILRIQVEVLVHLTDFCAFTGLLYLQRISCVDVQTFARSNQMDWTAIRDQFRPILNAHISTVHV